jgi:hypothetical protein
MTLEAHGYEVETAYTGEDGLKVKEVKPVVIWT